MQIDSESITAVTGIVAAVVTSGISHGVISTKVARLERDIEKAEKSYVPIDLFHATVDPIRKDLHEMQRDIKKILVAVNNKNADTTHSQD